MAQTNGKLGVGIVGCGDFLRWQVGALKQSESVMVKALYDTDRSHAQKYAEDLGGDVCDSGDRLLERKDIDIVCLFVPPWVRRELLGNSVAAGKHVLTTKPLGPSVEDCEAMVKLADGAVRCGVIYGRAGNGAVETYKNVFESGEIGRLALYRQDWIHHFPQWNTWATDPERNGGPFMDAMIHNLNVARYLMGRPASHCTLFSDNHAQSLKCNDTEFMKIDFEGSGSAHLFITWAADLAVHSIEGNYREHIDHKFMVTDQAWYVTEGTGKEGSSIVATRGGEKKTWPVRGPGGSIYDRFVTSVEDGGVLPRDISTVREAYEDIKLIRDAGKTPGSTVRADLALSG